MMITVNGIRNALWCAIAFGIVACASAPMPTDKLAVAKSAVDRAEQAQAAQFAQVELTKARNKLAAAQSAADKKDADHDKCSNPRERHVTCSPSLADPLSARSSVGWIHVAVQCRPEVIVWSHHG